PYFTDGLDSPDTPQNSLSPQSTLAFLDRSSKPSRASPERKCDISSMPLHARAFPTPKASAMCLQTRRDSILASYWYHLSPDKFRNLLSATPGYLGLVHDVCIPAKGYQSSC